MEGLDGGAKRKTCRGVYALEGDALRMTYAPPGADRPVGLDSKDPLASRLHLKRLKE
jgi:hypothetical protein